jgi:hypothetical protein
MKRYGIVAIPSFTSNMDSLSHDWIGEYQGGTKITNRENIVGFFSLYTDNIAVFSASFRLPGGCTAPNRVDTDDGPYRPPSPNHAMQLRHWLHPGNAGHLPSHPSNDFLYTQEVYTEGDLKLGVYE